MYLFIPCASCLAPGPLPQRLLDFVAPTAFSTLDGRHRATSYGMLLAWACPSILFKGLCELLMGGGGEILVVSLPNLHPGFFEGHCLKEKKKFVGNERPGLG